MRVSIGEAVGGNFWLLELQLELLRVDWMLGEVWQVPAGVSLVIRWLSDWAAMSMRSWALGQQPRLCEESGRNCKGLPEGVVS